MTDFPDRAARVLYIGIALIMILFLTVYVLHRTTGLIHPTILSWVHINAEYSLPAWYNTALLLIAGLLMGVAAATAQGRERIAWVILAVGVIALSMDEASGLHERLGRLAEWIGWDLGSFAWVGPGLVVAAIGSAVVIYFGTQLPRDVARRLLVALIVFGVSALGIEFVTGLLNRSYATATWFDLVVHPLLQILEESGEKIACVLAIHALLRFLIPRVEFRSPAAKEPGQPIVTH